MPEGPALRAKNLDRIKLCCIHGAASMGARIVYRTFSRARGFFEDLSLVGGVSRLNGPVGEKIGIRSVRDGNRVVVNLGEGESCLGVVLDLR